MVNVITKIKDYYRSFVLLRIYNNLFKYSPYPIASDDLVVYYNYYKLRYIRRIYNKKYTKFNIKLFKEVYNQFNKTKNIIRYSQIIENEYVCYENEYDVAYIDYNNICSSCKWKHTNCIITSALKSMKK